jgi:hypothetical protein
MPDSWLQVSLHPEDPATFQHDQGFPLFASVPEPKFYIALLASHAVFPVLKSKFHPIAVNPPLDSIPLLNNHKTVHFPSLYLLFSLPLTEKQSGVASFFSFAP